VRLSAVLLVLACQVHAAAFAGQDVLQVSVAVSLLPAVREAVESYRGQEPSVEVLLNAGGSGVLLQQALRGAPVDVLISASPVEIDRLVAEQRALPETRRRIASNRLVVVTPPSRPVPAGLDDLLRPEFDVIHSQLQIRERGHESLGHVGDSLPTDRWSAVDGYGAVFGEECRNTCSILATPCSGISFCKNF